MDYSNDDDDQLKSQNIDYTPVEIVDEHNLAMIVAIAKQHCDKTLNLLPYGNYSIS